MKFGVKKNSGEIFLGPTNFNGRLKKGSNMGFFAEVGGVISFFLFKNDLNAPKHERKH